MKNAYLALAAGLAAVSVAGDCNMDGGAPTGSPFTETDQSLCRGQGDGVWTFAMSTGLIDVPTPDRDNPNLDGAVSNTEFMIYDNTCLLKGLYGQPSCGIPWVIRESFLPMELIMKAVSTDEGQPYFSFAYGNGLYSINNNHCACTDASKGLEGAAHCGCAFPVNGTLPPQKREADERSDEIFAQMVSRVAKTFEA